MREPSPDLCGEAGLSKPTRKFPFSLGLTREVPWHRSWDVLEHLSDLQCPHYLRSSSKLPARTGIPLCAHPRHSRLPA